MEFTASRTTVVNRWTRG